MPENQKKGILSSRAIGKFVQNNIFEQIGSSTHCLFYVEKLAMKRKIFKFDTFY